jgi:hypothetical protein
MSTRSSSLPELDRRRSAARMARELGNARTLGWICVAAILHAVVIGATSLESFRGPAEEPEPQPGAPAVTAPAVPDAAAKEAPVPAAAVVPAAAAVPAAEPREEPKPASAAAPPSEETLRKVMKADPVQPDDVKSGTPRLPDLDNLLDGKR